MSRLSTHDKEDLEYLEVKNHIDRLCRYSRVLTSILRYYDRTIR